MRQMLPRFRTGTYAKAWIRRRSGRPPEFHKLREADRNHRSRQVGVRLRALMPFLKTGDRGRRPRIVRHVNHGDFGSW
jgi:ketol-acid reductoisomerase